jgi:RHS repeat-associated protein
MTWDGLEHLSDLELGSGTRLEFDWAVNFALLRRSVYDADGELLEQRLHLDDSCEQITDARGTWLRIRYRVHGEDLARRELLRVDGDWADSGTQPLPLVPVLDADPAAMTRSFDIGVETSRSGWGIASILVRGASDLPVAAAVLVMLALRLFSHRRFRFLVVELVRLGDGHVGRAFGPHTLRPRATAWRFTVVAGVASTMLFAPLLSCVDTVGGETESQRDGSGDEGSGGDVSVPVDRDDTYYMFAPWLGTVVMQTDAAGNIVGRSLVSPDGMMVRRQFDSTGLYYERFANAERCEFSDLVNFGARFYDPSTARWLNADPLAMLDQLSTAEMNGYAYVGWRLLRLLDALGLSGVEEDVGNAARATSGGLGTLGLLGSADGAPSAGGFGRMFSGVASGFLTGVGTAVSLSQQGASDVDIAAGATVSGFVAGALNTAAASNPVGATLLAADSLIGAINPDFAVSPVITAGYTGATLVVTGAVQGDLSAAHNFVDDVQAGGVGYIAQGAAIWGDTIAAGAHRVVMTGRHAAVGIEHATASAMESASGLIGRVDGAFGSPAASFADWLDR